MTPKQRAELAANAVVNWTARTREDREDSQRRRDDLAETLAALITPMCREKDCTDDGWLTPCAACHQLFCQTHIKSGTQSSGDVASLCVDCEPGPDPKEL